MKVVNKELDKIYRILLLKLLETIAWNRLKFYSSFALVLGSDVGHTSFETSRDVCLKPADNSTALSRLYWVP